jgi:hypothetical protein
MHELLSLGEYWSGRCRDTGYKIKAKEEEEEENEEGKS